MSRTLFICARPCWVLTCSCVFAQESNPDQEQIIAMIKKMGGEVAIDRTRPGKPVVQIHLYQGKTAGIGLEPLTKLSEVDWIGLHDSDITGIAFMPSFLWHAGVREPSETLCNTPHSGIVLKVADDIRSRGFILEIPIKIKSVSMHVTDLARPSSFWIEET